MNTVINYTKRFRCDVCNRYASTDFVQCFVEKVYHKELNIHSYRTVGSCCMENTPIIEGATPTSKGALIFVDFQNRKVKSIFDIINGVAHARK